jgi:hypothetical protein
MKGAENMLKAIQSGELTLIALALPIEKMPKNITGGDIFVLFGGYIEIIAKDSLEIKADGIKCIFRRWGVFGEFTWQVLDTDCLLTIDEYNLLSNDDQCGFNYYRYPTHFLPLGGGDEPA